MSERGLRRFFSIAKVDMGRRLRICSMSPAMVEMMPRRIRPMSKWRSYLRHTCGNLASGNRRDRRDSAGTIEEQLVLERKSNGVAIVEKKATAV